MLSWRRCCCTGPPDTTVTCSPCNVPTSALTFTAHSAFFGDNSCTLTYDSSLGKWVGSFDFTYVSRTRTLWVQVACSGGLITLCFNIVDVGNPSNSANNCCTNIESALVLADHTCSPFHMHWHFVGDALSPFCQDYQGSFGLTDFYLDG